METIDDWFISSPFKIIKVIFGSSCPRDYAILLIISFSRSIENVSWWDSDEFNRLEGFKHKLTSDPKGQSISACWKAWYPYNLSKLYFRSINQSIIDW